MPENPRVSRQTRKESRKILPDQHFHRGNIAYKYRNMETMADATETAEIVKKDSDIRTEAGVITNESAEAGDTSTYTSTEVDDDDEDNKGNPKHEDIIYKTAPQENLILRAVL